MMGIWFKWKKIQEEKKSLENEIKKGKDNHDGLMIQMEKNQRREKGLIKWNPGKGHLRWTGGSNRKNPQRDKSLEEKKERIARPY